MTSTPFFLFRLYENGPSGSRKSRSAVLWVVVFRRYGPVAAGGVGVTINIESVEKTRLDFVINLVGHAGDGKVSSRVHHCLAECMGEGVDPTQTCQSLVDKVAQSKQLRAINDPEPLVLFEEWFEDLEEEAMSLLEGHGPMSAGELAK